PLPGWGSRRCERSLPREERAAPAPARRRRGPSSSRRYHPPAASRAPSQASLRVTLPLLYSSLRSAFGASLPGGLLPVVLGARHREPARKRHQQEVGQRVHVGFV